MRLSRSKISPAVSPEMAFKHLKAFRLVRIRFEETLEKLEVVLDFGKRIKLSRSFRMIISGYVAFMDGDRHNDYAGIGAQHMGHKRVEPSTKGR
jgi:hypothetical protein